MYVHVSIGNCNNHVRGLHRDASAKSAPGQNLPENLIITHGEKDTDIYIYGLTTRDEGNPPMVGGGR